MKHFWKTRIIKHRLYTGDINNHIGITSIELVDSEPEVGLYVFEVTVHFEGSDEIFYQYEVEVDNPDLSEDEAIELIKDEISLGWD